VRNNYSEENELEATKILSNLGFGFKRLFCNGWTNFKRCPYLSDRNLFWN